MFRASADNERLHIVMALVAVYIVLGLLYESYVHPITILSTLPSAGVGALQARTENRIIRARSSDAFVDSIFRDGARGQTHAPLSGRAVSIWRSPASSRRRSEA